MIAVVQRVTEASVEVEGEVVGAIAAGLVVLLGVSREDQPCDASQLADRVAGLRIFADQEGKMNLSLLQVGGELLAVSQFTLLGDCSKGRRPSFVKAAPPDEAKSLYEQFVAESRRLGVPTATGIFQADMRVRLTNDGPVTLVLDTRK